MYCLENEFFTINTFDLLHLSITEKIEILVGFP